MLPLANKTGLVTNCCRGLRNSVFTEVFWLAECCEENIGQLPLPNPTLSLSLSVEMCGGVSNPLVDYRGNIERCNEGGILGYGCPPLHYCHHGVCCPGNTEFGGFFISIVIIICSFLGPTQ